METILLSIKPEFAGKILDGRKTFEFRKTAPRRGVDKVILYETAPTMMVVGEAAVESTLIGSPENVWKLCRWGGGIDERRYRAYFEGSERAVAFRLTDPKRYRKPVPIEEYGLSRCPQSYAYVKDSGE